MNLYKYIIRLRPTMLASAIKTILRVRRRIVTTANGRFFVDPASSFGIILAESGVYEPEIVGLIRETLRPGQTFIDVGANEGYHTIIAAIAMNRTGKIIAVEPQRRLWSALETNLRLNDSEAMLIPAVLSDYSGQARLYLYPSSNPGASSLFRPTRYPLPFVTVPSTTLERLFDEQEIGVCHLMKIDVEGAEYEVIKGGRTLFERQQIKTLVLEPSIRRGHSLTEIGSFLIACGYRPSETNSAQRQIWKARHAD